MSSRKRRPSPIEQGCLADIYRHFFGKLIYCKPQNQSIEDWMAMLFDIKHRDIVRFEAKRAFKMPGLFYQASHVKVQGIGYRAVKSGTILWVRMDARQPDIIDVEWMGGVGEKDQVFCLTASEWEWVKLHCRDAERQINK